MSNFFPATLLLTRKDVPASTETTQGKRERETASVPSDPSM